MRYFLSLFAFLLLSINSVRSEEVLHVVYESDGKRFSMNGYDLIKTADDDDFPVRTGDLFFIDDVQKHDLPAGSLYYELTLCTPDKKQSRSFNSRIVSKSDELVVLKAEEWMRTTTHPQWIPGQFHPEVGYNLTMEDGTSYSLSCYFSVYDHDDEAQAVLATMIVEPGDLVNFISMGGCRWWENPYHYEYRAAVNHEGHINYYRLVGLQRGPMEPFKKPNTFKVEFAGVHNIYGIAPRSFNIVKFKEFLPYTNLRVKHSALSMEEISNLGELQFIRREGNESFVFKDPHSTKEVTLYIWRSPGF